MNVLVVIANYGTANDAHMRRLLAEYRLMSHDVHVVALCNTPRDLGDDVEVVVEIPRGDPWTFPFAHKRIFAERLYQYDLFIYSEDDTLISQRNIDAFLQTTGVLLDGEIAGFIRSEQAADGDLYFSTAHGHFHWDPNSVVTRGAFDFAFFTNEHSGCYILTREQLQRSIQSGGFLVGPHQGRYGLPETAATDLYTQCGFRKMVCISHIQDFIVPHLPNKYIGKLGVRDSEFFKQIEALESIAHNARPASVLMNTETNLNGFKYSKSYYEPALPEMALLVPDSARQVLSYGCGWGALERELVGSGHQITAVALDSVIGACAEGRKIEVVYGDSATALASLSGRFFDCVLIPNVLHLVKSPEQLLRSLSELVRPGGAFVGSVPNLTQAPIVWRRMIGRGAFRNLTDFERSGTHLTSYRKLQAWFKTAGLTVEKIVPLIPRRAEFANRATGKLMAPLLAEDLSILARKCY